MNNFSMFTADRMTHLKVVAVALVCATLVAGLGVAARVTDSGTADGRLEATVIKAGKPVTASTSEPRTIRCQFTCSQPPYFARPRARFFLGLCQHAPTRAVVLQPGHAREKFPAASRSPPRRSFVKLGPGRRGPSRRRGCGERNTRLAHQLERLQHRRDAIGRESPRGEQRGDGCDHERHQDRECSPASHPPVDHQHRRRGLDCWRARLTRGVHRVSGWRWHDGRT